MKACDQVSEKRSQGAVAGALRLVFAIAGIVMIAAWGGWSAFHTPRDKNRDKIVTAVDELEAEPDIDSGWKSQPGYVGSQACGKCHAEQTATYLETAHSRALSEVVP